MVVLLNNHQLLPWQMLHSGGIEDTFWQFRMICGLFWHNNWPVILATKPSRPIYGLLPFGAILKQIKPLPSGIVVALLNAKMA